MVGGVEAEMKPRKGNGTPHPNGRRRPSMPGSPEEDIHTDQMQRTELAQSSIHRLLQVHTQVAQTLHQIDKLVLNIHKLASAHRVAPDEVEDFADDLASIDTNLQDWSHFLEAAAERSSLILEQEPCSDETPESTPVKYPGFSPLLSDLGSVCISCSPLVSRDLLDPNRPCSSDEPYIDTTPDKTSNHKWLSPFPQTPRMLSPPRSVQVLSSITESPSLRSLAHSFDVSSDPPKSHDLFTTEGPSRHCPLGLKTPSAQAKLNDSRFGIPETPGFDVSPPRTCRLGELASIESHPTPPTLVMPSPFRTPGISLECGSETTESSSPGSPEIVDDLTASTVKRLGPRGLEERLWQELRNRKADSLQAISERSLFLKSISKLTW